jgi:hypothetical protein
MLKLTSVAFEMLKIYQMIKVFAILSILSVATKNGLLFFLLGGVEII